ncbi:MAG: zinc ribbon domain-containing protein [Stackebrandtia sp.]
MKADPADQRRLLDLQQADTAVTQLTHRRTRLPETAEIAKLRGEVDALAGRQAEHDAGASDLARDIDRVEREIEQVRARAERDRQRQTDGGATPKELEGLTHELETLARRQSELEDQELELMERRETSVAAAAEAGEELERKREQLADAQEREAAALSDIDSELDKQRAAHQAVAAELPEDLVKLYEKIRGGNHPIAAALLLRRRCESCRIEASGGELAELRAAAPEDVVRCENCRSILVRTEESGL